MLLKVLTASSGVQNDFQVGFWTVWIKKKQLGTKSELYENPIPYRVIPVDVSWETSKKHVLSLRHHVYFFLVLNPSLLFLSLISQAFLNVFHFCFALKFFLVIIVNSFVSSLELIHLYCLFHIWWVSFCTFCFPLVISF